MPDKIDQECLAELAATAHALGFARMAALRVSEVEARYREFYEKFIARGWHADLKYLERPERYDLRAILPGAQTLILFTYPYRYTQLEKKLKAAPYKVARYAWQRDYHVLLKEKLNRIAAQADLTARAVTDSAPVFERYWARRAGLGKVGRNGMLIDPGHGSYFMIASLLILQPLADVPREQGDYTLSGDFATLCADCRLCIEACPTQALAGDGLMDTAKCISYQTIEQKEDAPATPPVKKHRWIFGCDICQQVCPYNKTPNSYAHDEFSEEHPAVINIANGKLPAARSQLKNSVFYRRGLTALRRNFRNLE